MSNDYIHIKVGGRVKRINRDAAIAYFRGTPLCDPEAILLNSFLRVAANHPDPRISREYDEIRAAVMHADPVERDAT